MRRVIRKDRASGVHHPTHSYNDDRRQAALKFFLRKGSYILWEGAGCLGASAHGVTEPHLGPPCERAHICYLRRLFKFETSSKFVERVHYYNGPPSAFGLCNEDTSSYFETSFRGNRDFANCWSAEDPVMTTRRVGGPQRMHQVPEIKGPCRNSTMGLSFSLFFFWPGFGLAITFGSLGCRHCHGIFRRAAQRLFP